MRSNVVCVWNPPLLPETVASEEWFGVLGTVAASRTKPLQAGIRFGYLPFLYQTLYVDIIIGTAEELNGFGCVRGCVKFL